MTLSRLFLTLDLINYPVSTLMFSLSLYLHPASSLLPVSAPLYTRRCGDRTKCNNDGQTTCRNGPPRKPNKTPCAGLGRWEARGGVGWGGGGIDPCLVTFRPRALAGRLAPQDVVSGRGEGGSGRGRERRWR